LEVVIAGDGVGHSQQKSQPLSTKCLLLHG